MKQLLLFAIGFFILSGCVKNNPQPVWLEINNWTLNANPNSTQDPGVLTHNFSDVWVYINGKVIGVFEVPCKIPVLASGSADISLFPAINNNGISSTKKIYPFVKPYETSLSLTPGETYTINPQTTYYDKINFWVEDFENAILKIEDDNEFSQVSLQVGNNSAISQWGYYGHVHLTDTDSMWVGITNQMALPKGGAEVYMEINYKVSNPVTTGLKAISTSSTTDNPLYVLKPRNNDFTWKKMYLDLRETVSYSTAAYTFQHYFKSELIDEFSEGDIYLDNIKIVYFE